MRALVLVDVQNDFLPGGALAVPNGDEVIPVANQLMSLKGKLFDCIIATQDWHPSSHKSFASQHRGKDPFDQVDSVTNHQTLWPDHCIVDSLGAEFPTDLNLSPVDQVIRKGSNEEVDSYSAFFDNDHKSSTGLAELLKKKKVSEVYVLGLASDYCIKHTALDSKALGFKTVIIEDACRGVNLTPSDTKQAFELLSQNGIEFIQSAKLLKNDQIH